MAYYRSPRLIKAIVLFFVSILLLFEGFYSNFWYVAEQEWFKNNYIEMDSHIVGRMVKSRQDGIFSAGGFTGFGSPNETPATFDDKPFSYQFEAYLHESSFGAYTPYRSQIGFQGMFFSFLDQILSFKPGQKLKLFYGLTSLLTALSLTIIVLWFYLEFGLSVAAAVLISAVLSQWLLIFARNLFWSTWAFYLPMIVLMFYFRKNNFFSESQYLTSGIFIFIVVFIKCLFNGYEYMTTALVMMMVPFAFYSISNKTGYKKFIQGSSIAMFYSFLAILVSFIILIAQIASVKGSFHAGINHIVYSLEKRTYADPQRFSGINAESLSTNVFSVVMMYLKGTFLDLNNYFQTDNPFVSTFLFQIRYIYLILFFGIVSIYVFTTRKRYVNKADRQKIIALIVSVWFSILAPFSWFVIFKAHSYEHPHMNFIVWQMPFTLFGFALCGLAFKTLWQDVTFSLKLAQ